MIQICSSNGSFCHHVRALPGKKRKRPVAGKTPGRAPGWEPSDVLSMKNIAGLDNADAVIEAAGDVEKAGL